MGYAATTTTTGTYGVYTDNLTTASLTNAKDVWFSPAGSEVTAYKNATKYLMSDVSPKTTVNRRNVSNKYNAVDLYCGK